MSLRINLNAAALGAHRSTSASDSALTKSIERLSSGFRVNSAGDDPAGLVISEKLRAQIGGLGQAIKNAGDAVNMVKTAEGALSETARLLRSMRDLAVHAASTATTDSAALAADQAQITSAIASITKISAESAFGGKKLLDGSAGTIATLTGTSVLAADLTKANNLTAAVPAVYIDVTTAATKATLSGTVTVATATVAGDLITINGSTFTATGTTIASLIAVINAGTNTTGVVASGTTELVLNQRDYGSAKTITVTGASAHIWTNVATTAAGVDAVAQVTTDGTTGALTAGTGGLNWSSGAGTLIKDSLGNSIQLTETAATAVTDKGAQMSLAVGTMTFQVGAFAGETRTMQINSSASNQLGLGNGGATANVSLIDVTTSAGAQAAMTVLDKAISDVSTARANLGATQTNVLQSAISSLTIAKENISASESSIRDTDMAAEMAEFTKQSILSQAGIAMMAQANQGQQAILSLLR